MMTDVRVALVNHDTSMYAELALRTLCALNDDVDFDITVIDNASEDETSPLFTWAGQNGIAVQQSGFSTSESVNTHGEVLGRAVLESPPTEHFLFLDADACFLESGTVSQMRARLRERADIFAVQADMRLFVTEALGLQPRHRDYIDQPDGTQRRLFPRPHPYCLMVRDSGPFRAVVEHIGLSVASRSAASRELCGSYDTFGLATAAMRTHGYGWDVAGGPVLHYAQAAERRDPEDLMRLKDDDCERRLELARDDGRVRP